MGKAAKIRKNIRERRDDKRALRLANSLAWETDACGLPSAGPLPADVAAKALRWDEAWHDSVSKHDGNDIVIFLAIMRFDDHVWPQPLIVSADKSDQAREALHNRMAGTGLPFMDFFGGVAAEWGDGHAD
jgi:hypothetical protein